MKSLYEIDQEILACLDLETGEILDETKLDELQMMKDTKIEQLCLWHKNLKAEAEMLKKEEDSFAKRRKSAATKAENIKKYLEGYLDGATFKSTRAKVSYRKSEAVDVKEDAVIPAEYLKMTVEVKKAELKEAIKEGKTFEGVTLVERKNIQIG